MPNMTSNLSATITAVDVDTKTPVTRDIGSPSYAGKTGEYVGFQELAAGETTITLPVSPVLCFWIRNRSGANTVSVKWTPQGGVEAIAGVLVPGGSMLFWNPSTVATAGITSLKLTPSVAAVPVEMYMGG